jgi:hypothetical protein
MILDLSAASYFIIQYQKSEIVKRRTKKRTKIFHLAVIKCCEVLPKKIAGFELTK